jgi:hypothetical protein
MGIYDNTIGRVLCALGVHSYETTREQLDIGYVRKRCSRCGAGTYRPR